MRKIQLLALVAAMAMTVGLMAVPASAETPREGVLTFVGTAEVCATYDGSGGPKATGAAGNCDPGETGLYIPGPSVPGVSNGGQRNGSYSFDSVTCAYVGIAGTNPLSSTACSIEVDGLLSPAGGIGAACGMSHGHSGANPVGVPVELVTGVLEANVSEVGWVASAGGTLPITGHYETTVTPAGKKAGPWTGSLTGVVQAQGGGPCVKNPVSGNGGADSFNVAGVIEVL